jgi:flavin reductase (DIM6/NTAB) family NADH-FMN oxidoreductase RutF
MGQLDHPMVIVTTASGDVRAGCLVGFHTQCGMEPSAYSVWLSKANHTYRIGSLAEVFAVHFPRRANHDLAELFGSETGDEIDKFERCAWTAGPQGVPLLDDCADRFVGRRIAFLDAGTDHACLILRPLDTAHDDRSDRPDWLTLSQVLDLDPGHPAGDRQEPG